MENLKHVQYTPAGVCSKIINFDLNLTLNILKSAL